MISDIFQTVVFLHFTTGVNNYVLFTMLLEDNFMQLVGVQNSIMVLEKIRK